MAGRSLGEAVRLHLGQIQQLVSCVTSSVLVVAGSRDATQRRGVSLAGGTADLAGARLKLAVQQHFRTFDLAGRYTLIVVGYQYALCDAAEKEILAYHWHPIGKSRFTQPHLHLGPAAQVKQRDLASAPLPTSHVSLADVIELAIHHFGVEPRLDGWRQIIAEVRASR